MKYPLVGLCIAFCLGVIFAASLRIPFFIFYALTAFCLVFSLIFFMQKTKFSFFLYLAVFFLGASLLKNSQILPDNHIARLVSYAREPVSLTGVIDNDPIYRAEKENFILKVQDLEMDGAGYKTCGKVLVRVTGKTYFSYGDRLSLKGRLYQPISFSKEERFNYRQYLKHQGIYLVMSVKKDEPIRHLDKNTGNLVKSVAFRMRHKMKAVMDKNLSPFSAAILNAIILGERQDLSARVRDALVYSGTVHIIAIAGLHLGIFAFIILLVLKMIRIPRRSRYVLAILLLVFYCLLTGANTPVLRATVMATALLFSYLFKREVNIYNSLSLAALIILAFSPWQIFEVSFQLSFLSVVSIVWLSPKIKTIFPKGSNKIPGVSFLIQLFSTSLAAWLGLLPLIAYYFRVLSPITVLANMIIVPYMTIIIASGFTLALVGMLIPALASIFAASNELFILILFKLNTLLIAIPGAYFKLPEAPFVYILLYYGLLISVFNLQEICAFIKRWPAGLSAITSQAGLS